MTTLRVSTSREVSSEDSLLFDIYALSTILTKHRVDASQHADQADKQLTFWCNLSFLLSTTFKGAQNNTKGANSVVAVTGNLEITANSYTITAAVVARNDSRPLPTNNKANSEADAPRIVHVDVQQDSDKAIELLEDPKTDIELEDHVRDVFTILLHCMTLSPDEKPLYLPYFTSFTALCTYRKLVSRLHVGPKTWGTNPIRIIYRKWSDTSLPPESSELNQSILIKDPTVRHILGDDFHVPPGSGENTFLLNASTAGTWARVLLNAPQDLEAQTGLIAIVGNGVGDAKYKTSPAPLNDNERLLDAIIVLDQFVTTKALAHLLTESVAKDIHAKYNKDAIKSGNDKPLVETQSSGESSTEAVISEGSVDDNDNKDMIDADDGASITSEDEGDVTFDYLQNTLSIPVIRYISSLATPLSASRAIFEHLFRSLNNAADVSVSMVTLAGIPRIHVNQNRINDTQQRLTNTLHLDDTQAERLRALLSDKLKHPLLVTVHAEAALMAAAVQVAEGKLDSDALQATPANEQKIRIGISKKCCFCCAVLGEELNHWGREIASTGSYPQFVLPGRHGIIFSWYSPPGISANVLRKMVTRLEGALKTFLVTTLGPRSGQTSPAISETANDADMVYQAYRIPLRRLR
ncbi:hypothetical protein C8Q80DRAFT_1275874 [Daedaleopsis nitida]|nr:hypothetical protein C8Q80DRAFT_1275874 [Daedaleopsis nitida]